MPRYAIHAETRLVRNIRGELAPWVEQYHLVEVGTGLDEAGDQHSVCNQIVESESSKPLGSWEALREDKRCHACEDRVGHAVKKQAEKEGITQSEWWRSHT